MATTPTRDQIDDQLNKAAEAEETGQSSWPGMTYEQGVDAAIRWMTGESDDLPMEDD
jgi:hypothetical protein